MTIPERNEKLKIFMTCLKCEASGKMCDGSCTNKYHAGTLKEIIENLEAISEVLEQETVSKESYDHEYLLRKELEMKITKLEQQEPCEDVISRQSVLDCIRDNYRRWFINDDAFMQCMQGIKSIISVTSQEPVLGKIRAEIDRQEKWLLQLGYTAYNVDIAFGAIKAVLAESEAEE